MPLLPHSVWQNKSQGYSRHKEWGKSTRLVDGRRGKWGVGGIGHSPGNLAQPWEHLWGRADLGNAWREPLQFPSSLISEENPSERGASFPLPLSIWWLKLQQPSISQTCHAFHTPRPLLPLLPPPRMLFPSLRTPIYFSRPSSNVTSS